MLSKLSTKFPDITQRVQQGKKNGIMFRPNTSILQTEKFIIDCMEKCWQEEPESRPDFHTVRDLLRGLHSGL